MSEEGKLRIKRGKIDITIPRSELVEVCETHDGVAFNFKGGLQFYFTENYMQTTTKQLIKSAIDNYPGKTVIVNLDNPRQPAMVDAT